MVRRKVSDILKESVLKGRSPLYRWLHENYGQIAPIIAKQPRPSWEALAATVAEGSDLSRPTRQGVRKAWLRVAEEMNRTEADPPAPRSIRTQKTPNRTAVRMIEPPPSEDDDFVFTKIKKPER
jgi:hypothetical protein